MYEKINCEELRKVEGLPTKPSKMVKYIKQNQKYCVEEGFNAHKRYRFCMTEVLPRHVYLSNDLEGFYQHDTDKDLIVIEKEKFEKLRLSRNCYDEWKDNIGENKQRLADLLKRFVMLALEQNGCCLQELFDHFKPTFTRDEKKFIRKLINGRR